MPDPTIKSVAEVRDRFTDQLKATTKAGANAEQAVQLKEQLQQHQIDKGKWKGDVFDLDGIHDAFDREENEDDVIKAIRDPSEPGTVGDLMVSSLQGDYLATMERAFRARHQTRIRADVHAAARRRGHGHDAGLFQRGVVGYIEGLLKLSKEDPG